MPVSNRLVTAEEFQQVAEPEGRRLELVRGHVVTMVAPGGRHASVALRLGALLLQHVDARGLGRVFDAVGCRLASNPDTIRVPDLAFVQRARLGPGGAPRGFLGPPDLAVEITSPTDRGSAIDAKAAEYLEHGVRMVWIVDPERETVTVHEPGLEALTLREGGVLDGRDVIPGFTCDIRRIFG